MQSLADVAHQLLTCIDGGDAVATTVMRARLERVGDGALSALWNLQNLYV
ncbi:hypothetical protein [Thalassovita gelatinovora]|nr:hypothetical protein [Thalassovita gelatinovora]QIZ80707.1 hypothetical protein HFZ77_09550 [Thalassovita gelatinovora]